MQLPTVTDTIRRYGIALAAVGLALALRAAAEPVLGPSLPHATLFGGVALAAWFTGAAPALIATFLGYVAANHLFLELPFPAGYLKADQLLGLALSLLSCLVITRFTSVVHEAKRDPLGAVQPAGAEGRARDAARPDDTGRGRLEDTLRRSEHLYRAIGESINYGIWVCDPDGRNVYASDSFLRLVGLTQDECSFHGWLRVLHPDDADATAEAWAACVRTGSFWEREHRFKGVDGGWHHVLARGVPIRDETGAVTHWAGINLDIGDLKTAQEDLQEADRLKDEFLATLAHELRNPLAAIRNVTHLSAPGSRVTAEKTQWSRDVLERQVRHLSRLVDDLLDVSRITRGKVRLRSELVLLSTVLQDALETSRPDIEAGRHLVTCSLPEEPLCVRGDLTRLSQVAANLLSNAAKYTPPGGRIEAAVRAEPGHGVLTVTDNGVGIPASMLTRVFDMFIQVDSALDRSTGGLGIGLTLVRRLVEMHGGSVCAFSDGPGCGSRFEVRLPLIDPELVPCDPPIRAHPDPVAASPRRILVVDDNRDAADSLALLLKVAGHDVQTVYDGEQALVAAEKLLFDAVLLDIGLPRLNGYEVARRLRREPRGRDITLVAITGWGQDEDRQRSREAGFDLHLVKPVDLEALRDVLTHPERS